MKVSELITDIAAKIDTNASEADMLNWINTLEQSIYRNIIKEGVRAYIDIVAEQATYDISSEAYSFEDINVLIIDSVKYTKISAFSDDAYYTFYKSGTSIVVYPTPLTAKTDGIEVRYVRKPTLKTSENKTTLDLDIIAEYGNEFIPLYRYYCYRQACVFAREYADANTWATMYNDMEGLFFAFYARQKPKDAANYRKRYWR